MELLLGSTGEHHHDELHHAYASRLAAEEARLERARTTALALQERIGNRSNAPIRRHFIARPPGTESAPPLAQVLRSGRGAGVRLKLLLSLLWVAVAEPHDVSLPARTWASLLGLRDPEGAGARQVRSGFAWLEKHAFVVVEEDPGHPSRITLLDERATDEDYVLPAVAFARARMAEEDPDAHIYVRLPSEYWTNGWAASLSGPATAMLLVLLDARGGRSDDRELWFSPRVADTRYALSENTRTAGFKELADAGLVVVHRRPVDPQALTYRRVRNTYTLMLDNLSTLLPGGRQADTDEESEAAGPEPGLQGTPATDTSADDLQQDLEELERVLAQPEPASDLDPPEGGAVSAVAGTPDARFAEELSAVGRVIVAALEGWGIPDADVQDVLQRILTTIAHNPERFASRLGALDEHLAHRAYFTRMALNDYLMQLRSERRVRLREERAVVGVPANAGVRPQADDVLALLSFEATLTPRQRELLGYVLVDDLSIEEAARMAGTTPHVVRAILRRAVQKVRMSQQAPASKSAG